MRTLWAYVFRLSKGGYLAHVQETLGGNTQGSIPSEALEAIVAALRGIASVPADADLDVHIRFSPGHNTDAIWVPGMFLAHRTAGYTLAEARSAVGPGWAALVDGAYRRLTDAACKIVQVKEKLAGLRIYYHWPIAPLPDGVQLRSARTLSRYLGWLEHKSLHTCEGCGAPGTECKHFSRLRTLCPACAWRWKEGARHWSDIRGEWPPPLDEDSEP